MRFQYDGRGEEEDCGKKNVHGWRESVTKVQFGGIHSSRQKKLLKRNRGVSFGETGRKISEKMIRKLSGCYTFDKELEPRIVGNEKIGRKSVRR